jgi:hypothetical protein
VAALFCGFSCLAFPEAAPTATIASRVETQSVEKPRKVAGIKVETEINCEKQ